MILSWTGEAPAGVTTSGSTWSFHVVTGTGVCPNVSPVLTRGLKAPLGCGFIFGVSPQLQYGHRNPQMHIVTHQDLQTPCPRHTLVLHIWSTPMLPSLRTRHRDGPLSPLPADPSSVASHTSSVLESKENCHRKGVICPPNEQKPGDTVVPGAVERSWMRSWDVETDREIQEGE